MSELDYRQFCVLFVDDEEQARKYFRMALAPELEVITAGSAEEVDAMFAEHGDRIGIVVSDQRMPGEGGSSLLGRVRRRAPKTVRILTTAYADMKPRSTRSTPAPFTNTSSNRGTSTICGSRCAARWSTASCGRSAIYSCKRN